MLKKKQIFYIILVLLIFLFLVLGFFSIQKIRQKHQSLQAMEKALSFDSNSPFSINKIVYFSSANASSKINPNSSFTISDLYQYTDIAIFINNNANRKFHSRKHLKSSKIIRYYI